MKYLLKLFFLFAFLGCDTPPPIIDESGEFELVDAPLSFPILPVSEPFSWNSLHGFRPNNEHLYGSDKHVNPTEEYQENMNVSVKIGMEGFVDVFINTDMDEGYSYFICDEQKNRLYDISVEDENTGLYIEKIEFTEFVVGGGGEKQALWLCGEYGGELHLIQELSIYFYEEKSIDFSIFYNGDLSNAPNGLIFHEEFWNSFDDVYSQAVVRHGGLQISNILYTYSINDGNNTRSTPKNYYLTKISNPDNSCNYKGDLEKEMDNIIDNIRAGVYGSRTIWPLGLPTKDFWELKISSNGTDVEICGNPDELPVSGQIYELLPRDNHPISLINGQLPQVKKNGNGFEIKEFDANGNLVWNPLTIQNVAVNATILAKKAPSSLDDQNVSSIFEDPLAAAITKFITQSDSQPLEPQNVIGALAVIKWQGEDSFTRNVLHEMGHTLSLFDLERFSNAIDSESEQGNLMYYMMQKGTMLRNRIIDQVASGTAIANGEYDMQWDCLQRIGVNTNLSPCGVLVDF
jgi:hypothetical protein